MPNEFGIDETDAPLESQEDFDDLVERDGSFFGATLWSTDWTAETIINQLRRGNIDLNPRFQRRQAWEPRRQSRYIESLILGLPTPQIILAESKTKKNSFIVIDGKQRLLTLRKFVSEDETFRPFRLTGLEDRPDLNGVSYSDLLLDERLSEERNSFENQTIRTVVIRNWQSDVYLHTVFLRINSGSVQLSPQELRLALKPGPFADFIDDFSVVSDPLRSALKLTEPDFRMRDSELALRYFAYRRFAPHYGGNLKQFLDGALDYGNRHWIQMEREFREDMNQLNEALIAIRGVFGARDELRKYNGDTYEKRINRAVFDIMVYYASMPDIRDRMQGVGPAIKGAFESACSNNVQFVSSLEATTKSRESNFWRFCIWSEILSDSLGDRRIVNPFQ